MSYRRSRPRRRWRPRLGRQLAYAAVTFAAILAGYWLAGGFGRTEDRGPVGTGSVPSEAAAAEGQGPWFERQGRPPSLVSVPDAPILPDNGDGSLAYEEALPQEIYTSSKSIPVPPPPEGAHFKSREARTPFGGGGGLTPPSGRPAAPAPDPKPQSQATENTVTVRPVAEEPMKASPAPAPAPDPDPEKAAVAEPAPEKAPSEEPVPAEAASGESRVASLAPPPERTRPTDLPPWKRHAAAAPPIEGRPMIALVIDDLGVDRRHTRQVIALDGPLTLSFLSYGRDLPEQTLAARSRGHELMVHVPMQPGNADLDPGPKVLETGLSEAEVRSRLDWALGRFDGYVGINNHMGSRFTADGQGMRTVMAELQSRGLLFLDSRTTGATAGSMTAIEAGVPFAERNVFIDNVNDVAAVNDRLADLEAVARRQGYAVGIGHPRDATIEALRDWVAGLHQRGFVLVPLTTIVRRLEAVG